jgi:hypothetical protein
VDLEAEVTTLQEDVHAGDIERFILLQNITEMQQQVEEAKIQIAALHAVVALQPLPPVEAPPEEQQGQSGLDQASQAGPLPPTDSDSVTLLGAILGAIESLTCGSHMSVVPHVSDSMAPRMAPSNVTESQSQRNLISNMVHT